ncbi:MAG: THUMP domain-containing protein [Candidatus Bathyarchaeia archaeon]
METKFIITVPSGFEKEAKKEVLSLIPNSKVQSMFFKGNLFVETTLSESDVIKKLLSSETLYLGRVFPVETKIEISQEGDNVKRLFEAIKVKLEPEDTFAVRCTKRGTHSFSSRDIERSLGLKIEQTFGARVDLTKPAKVVVVQIFQNIAYVGVTSSENLIVKTMRISRKYAKGERPFTRAEHKIREALDAFNLKIMPTFEILDLGAAPGGWTKVLAGSAKKVVAVDPADLDDEVTRLPNVVHLRCRAEHIPRDIGIFDLITNDMNLSPIESATIMVDVAYLLKEGGYALMTIKFVTRNRRKLVGEAIQILKSKYKDFKTRRLPHNRFETTLFMVKA